MEAFYPYLGAAFKWAVVIVVIAICLRWLVFSLVDFLFSDSTKKKLGGWRK